MSGRPGTDVQAGGRVYLHEANVAFRNANASTDDEEARRRYYNEAILCYEKLIRQGGIANSKLFYNLASAYLLNGDVGVRSCIFETPRNSTRPMPTFRLTSHTRGAAAWTRSTRPRGRR